MHIYLLGIERKIIGSKWVLKRINKYLNSFIGLLYL